MQAYSTSGKIVVTGAYGFIGCNLVRALNQIGFYNLILVDNFEHPAKQDNFKNCVFDAKINRDLFIEWLTENADEVSFIFHLGARTDTSEFNFRVLDSLNLSYSKALWEICTVKDIPLVYASSAATYGIGEKGFDDNADIQNLKPLNPYGLSKQLFDLFVVEQKETPGYWCGLKFFNVYGPHEAHKGRMASVVFHAYNQIKVSGKMKLFRSHRPDFKNGAQLRDFIFIDDVVKVCLYFYTQFMELKRENINGIYNLGTGKARTFNDLVNAVFAEMQIKKNTDFIDTPEDIRDKYQYFTEAKMEKLKSIGYNQEFLSIEKGIHLYVKYLSEKTNEI
jgi:ADP-L-glycero-D-manno-heptose 6-epimerase